MIYNVCFLSVYSMSRNPKLAAATSYHSPRVGNFGEKKISIPFVICLFRYRWRAR